MKKSLRLLLLTLVLTVACVLPMACDYHNHTTYTVKFETLGGSAVATQTIGYYNKAQEPTSTREGHDFQGWYQDQAYTKRFNFNTPITTNLTLYAKWSVKQCTLQFNGNGGFIASTQKVNYGQVIAEPLPGRADYAFLGWTVNNAFFDFSQPITGDLQLTAQWSDQYEFYPQQVGESYAVSSYTGAEDVVYLPKSYNNLPVVAVGQYAFDSNSTITQVVIPANIVEMGTNVFNGCSHLTSIICEATAKPAGWNDNWLGDCTVTPTWRI